MSENHSAITRLMYQLFIALGKKSVSVVMLNKLVKLTVVRAVSFHSGIEFNSLLVWFLMLKVIGLI